MSHKAVNWALEQKHLKPGPWIVLIQLADRHNKDTRQCNPNQQTLAEDCNMSKATVNRHLDHLEEAGLITRVQRQNPTSRKMLSTFYILGLDANNPPEIEFAMSQNETRKRAGENENKSQFRVSECDTVSESQIGEKPSLKKPENRVSNCDTNPVREPVKEPCADGASNLDEVCVGEVARRFIEAYPRSGVVDKVRTAVASALSAGVDPETLVAAARSYAEEQRGNAARYIAYPENWLERRGWERHEARLQASGYDPEAPLKSAAALIVGGNPALCRHVTAVTARELLHRGMVTVDQCRAAEVTW